MNREYLARLREEQQKELDGCLSRIAQLEKFISDYQKLSEKLETIPHKVSCDYNIAFGKYAFMPGKLVHTNEILVLLGDNWFAKRSAKQAGEITQRRIDYLKKQLADLNEEKKLLEPRLEYSAEFQAVAEEQGGVREILEEYDEEAERKWRVEHRKKVQAHRKQIKASQLSETSSEGYDIMAKLEKLEKQEEREEETNSKQEEALSTSLADSDVLQFGEGEAKQISVTGDQPLSKRVSFKDLRPNSVSDDSDSNDVNPPLRITIKHSQPDEINLPSTELSDIQSPSDIYKAFVQSHREKVPGKSILKTDSGTKPSVNFWQQYCETEKASEPHREPLQCDQLNTNQGKTVQEVTAISESVIEKVNSLNDSKADRIFESKPETPGHRPLSRFRAKRLGVSLNSSK